MIWLLPLAHATDSWSTVADGISLLTRTTSDPNDIWAVYVDLTNPHISLRATREWENQQTVPSFASDVGATVAVNGDWFSYDTYFPVGLAVGSGWGWTDNTDTAEWCFLACNVTKECWIDPMGNLQAWSPRVWNAVGGNGVRILIDGTPQVNTDSFYSVDQHPRTAVGLSQDGATMILVVVDGRSSRSVGMTFNEMGQLLYDLGAWQGMMLDGGGSSTMWVSGSVLNEPSDGSPRTVANHLAVMVNGAYDTGCADLPNGKYCVDATVMATCEGGVYTEGDCGYYGLTCEESGDFAYCVDPRCHNGGQQYFCDDDVTLGLCADGVVTGTGDCSYYGATCEEGSGTAYCVDYRCGGDGSQGWCTADVASTCTLGVYAETDCAASGQACVEGACVTPGSGDSGGSGGGAGGGDSPNGEAPGEARRLDAVGCGCASGGEGAGVGMVAAVLATVCGSRRARRRQGMYGLEG